MELMKSPVLRTHSQLKKLVVKALNKSGARQKMHGYKIQYEGETPT